MSKRTYLCGMKQETIPQAVIKEAQPFIDRYGNRLKYLGDVEGQKAWLLHFLLTRPLVILLFICSRTVKHWKFPTHLLLTLSACTSKISMKSVLNSLLSIRMIPRQPC